MKRKKILFTVILAAVVSPAFSCWYEAIWSHTDVVHAFNNASYFYLAGVNSDANHISDVLVSADSQTVKASYTVTNNVEVHLPLTVYVGKKETGEGGFTAFEGDDNYSTTHTVDPYDSYQTMMVFTLQYRVLPETTWHTAAVKRFAFSYAQLMSRKKLFGGFQLDFSAAPGSTVLIRLHIAGTVNQKEGAIERTYYRTIQAQGDIHDEDFASTFNAPYNWWQRYGYDSLHDSGSITSTTVAAENFDPSTIVYRTASEVPASKQCYDSPGGIFTGGFTQPYLGYDAYVMAVKIANKRRPGK